MNNLLAAFIFFTRLPFWRIKNVPPECFKQVVCYWPFVGWLTGGMSALILWITAHVLPFPVAVLLAILTRLLVTGALHEDGLADFLDGFGGGTNRKRILEIMKDSHMGSYGVIGLILYFLLFYTLLSALPLFLACIALVVGDTWCKFVSSNLINYLPYARKEEESKAKIIYQRMDILHFTGAAITGGVLGLLFLPIIYWPSLLLPVALFAFLAALMKSKLQGYTGDCCGATFLLCELSFYIGITIIYHHFL